MQRQRLKEAFAYCEGLSFAEVATYIDKFPNRVTDLHVAAVALSKKPEYAIGEIDEMDISKLKGAYGAKEAY